MRNSKTKGFTLVELIVVIAIIAILAAILVPNMLSYIKQSRYTQADANAKNIHTAATAAVAQAYVDGILGEIAPADLVKGTMSNGDDGFTAEVNGEDIDVPGIDPKSYSGNGAFTYDTSTLAVTAAAWSRNGDVSTFDGTIPSQEDQYGAEEIIGYYPIPIKGEAQDTGE